VTCKRWFFALTRHYCTPPTVRRAMSAIGTKRKCRRAHGISGAEGRPAVTINRQAAADPGHVEKVLAAKERPAVGLQAKGAGDPHQY
jgi:hypothetical protein